MKGWLFDFVLGLVVIAAAIWLVSCSVHAQETAPDTRLHWTPYVFMVAGQVADVSITARNFGRGCTEVNRGAFGSAQPTTARLVATKSAALAAPVLITLLLQKTGHQKAATVTGLLTGGIGLGAAGYNLTVRCGR